MFAINASPTVSHATFTAVRLTLIGKFAIGEMGHPSPTKGSYLEG